MAKVWDNELWLFIGLVSLVIFFTVIFSGCDDAPPPEIRYLGPPVVTMMNKTGAAHRLDAWQLDSDGYPESAAFGWRAEFHWKNTGEVFDEPGIHLVFTAGAVYYPEQDPIVLDRCVTGTGCEPGGDPDSITVITGDDGFANFYLSTRDWPHGAYLFNGSIVTWRVRGMDTDQTNVHSTSDADFMQGGAPFFSNNGGFDLSLQGMAHLPGGVGNTSSLPCSAPVPDFMPMDLGPTSPTPRVLVADIQPVLAECANSVNYPPYSDPNANGVGILIRSRWIKARVEDGEWVLIPAPFITLLPCDSNSIASVAETAWPYTISYHVPAESEEIGVIDAELSIVDPNGVEAEAIDIQVHEVGPCLYCSDWLWRSDYLLPLAGATQGPSLTRVGDVIVAWLPPGHKFKVEPAASAGAIYVLATSWLAGSIALDLNGDGVVNFLDYGVLWGMLR